MGVKLSPTSLRVTVTSGGGGEHECAHPIRLEQIGVASTYSMCLARRDAERFGSDCSTEDVAMVVNRCFRLIAAAPEMLVALKVTLGNLRPERATHFASLTPSRRMDLCRRSRHREAEGHDRRRPDDGDLHAREPSSPTTGVRNCRDEIHRGAGRYWAFTTSVYPKTPEAVVVRVLG